MFILGFMNIQQVISILRTIWTWVCSPTKWTERNKWGNHKMKLVRISWNQTKLSNIHQLYSKVTSPRVAPVFMFSSGPQTFLSKAWEDYVSWHTREGRFIKFPYIQAFVRAACKLIKLDCLKFRKVLYSKVTSPRGAPDFMFSSGPQTFLSKAWEDIVSWHTREGLSNFALFKHVLELLASSSDL